MQELLENSAVDKYPEIEGSALIFLVLNDMGITYDQKYIKAPLEMFTDEYQDGYDEYAAAYVEQSNRIWIELSNPDKQKEFVDNLLDRMKKLPHNTPADNAPDFVMAKLNRKTMIKLKKPEPRGTKRTEPFKFFDNTIEHYFIYEKNSGYPIDLLYWVADIPFSHTGFQLYDSATKSFQPRNNPYDPKTYSSDQTPLILWMAVRSVFLKGIPKEPKETTHAYITRLFRYHKMNGDETRKESVGRAYAIAIKTLQKKGFLKKGKRTATKKGIEQGEILLESLGYGEIKRRFQEFEKIINLSQGKRYVNY